MQSDKNIGPTVPYAQDCEHTAIFVPRPRCCTIAHMQQHGDARVAATLGIELGNNESSFEYFLRAALPKSARILDIGCNYGSLVRKLHETGYGNTYGIDVNEAAVADGKKAYPDIADYLQPYDGTIIPFPEDSFDAILMFDVIEHIPHLRPFMREVRRVMKKGARFIFQTPNKHINIPWEIISHRSLNGWREYHCSLQNRKSLRKLLVETDFENVIVEKNNIITRHNIEKVGREVGTFAIPLLYVFQRMPLALYPNLWGSCMK